MADSERDLLMGGGKKVKKPFYRPRPLWWVLLYLPRLPASTTMVKVAHTHEMM
ncbi:hypothetical protein GY45DRAFT_1329456, partial [Cubamyces sp. BRFM 1775]